MSKISKLFPSVPVGFEMRNEPKGWVIHSISLSSEAVEWLCSGEEGKLYVSLSDVVDFFGTTRINQLTARLGGSNYYV
jgi:hypothetical protein